MLIAPRLHSATYYNTTDSAEITISDSEEEDEDTCSIPKYDDVIVPLDTTLKYLRSIPESGDHVDAVEKAKQHCIDNRIEKLLKPRISSFFLERHEFSLRGYENKVHNDLEHETSFVLMHIILYHRCMGFHTFK